MHRSCGWTIIDTNMLELQRKGKREDVSGIQTCLEHKKMDETKESVERENPR